MREFNKVSAKYWMTGLSKKIRQLGTDAAYLSIYLQTNHHTHSLGMFYLPLQYIAHDTGITLNKVEELLKALCAIDFCCYDFESEYIWLKNYALEQSGGALKENDNRVAQLQRYFEELPQLEFLDAFYETHKQDFHTPHVLVNPVLLNIPNPSNGIFCLYSHTTSKLFSAYAAHLAVITDFELPASPLFIS